MGLRRWTLTDVEVAASRSKLPVSGAAITLAAAAERTVPAGAAAAACTDSLRTFVAAPSG